MYTKEDIEKTMKDIATTYFEEHFLGKNIDYILYEVSRKVMLELASILGQFQVLNICLSAIRSNTPYFEKLDSEAQERLEDTISAIDYMSEKIEELLTPNLEALKE